MSRGRGAGQEALGGGSGMALLPLLHQTPSPSSSCKQPPSHFLWQEGPLRRGREAGPVGRGEARSRGRVEGTGYSGLRACRIDGGSCQTPKGPFSNSSGTGLQHTAHRSAGCRTDGSSQGDPRKHLGCSGLFKTASDVCPLQSMCVCGGGGGEGDGSGGCQEPGAAGRFQTLDVSSGFKHPQACYL